MLYSWSKAPQKDIECEMIKFCYCYCENEGNHNSEDQRQDLLQSFNVVPPSYQHIYDE